ncbi:hypothetical protein NUW58_g4648 [Xylaria curta]|uniref:Uncharacterized protein n=1 Tax=Xylaria curta TaxID=42375 RepID=A0ACC1P5F7_9PEZI|nr:hypothetical protein NUW58_g4648 [Xylaria curta]
MTTSFEAIPTVELSLADDPNTLPQLLGDLRHALVDVGFLYISNHGVPSHVIAELVSALPELFSLKEESKRAVALENSPHFLGYSGVGSENTGGSVDLREQFEFATELTATWRAGLPLYERLRGPNQWPNGDAKLRAVIEGIHIRADATGGTFQPFLSDQHRLKLVHYPESGTSSSNQGVGPHKDSSGWWTFLLQASPPEVRGLQVLNKAGLWVDVPVVPGTLVVNIGQAFEVVTGGGVRRDLTKAEAVGALKAHFTGMRGGESTEGSQIDSAFLRGKYDTWGESQLRTKVRSHRQNGKKYYSEFAASIEARANGGPGSPYHNTTAEESASPVDENRSDIESISKQIC